MNSTSDIRNTDQKIASILSIIITEYEPIERYPTFSAVNWCIDRSLCDKSTKIGTNDR